MSVSKLTLVITNSEYSIYEYFIYNKILENIFIWDSYNSDILTININIKYKSIQLTFNAEIEYIKYKLVSQFKYFIV